MSDTVIKVEGLHKKFCRSLKRSMAYGLIDVSRSMLGITPNRGHLRSGEFWALKDISFEMKNGEALGIIGLNGSGKTTLLRLINGIFPPDRGRITVQGRIGALIAIGAGFHPHMTGKENIYLNGTILGMNRNEIRKNFDSIVDFADIGDFLDAPVATYSSGMTVRLGFSIAIHSNPSVLLADEVLAVGDLSFALKCHRKVAEYRDKGGSIVLVSHGMQLVRNVCQRVLWINAGITEKYGKTQEVCDDYENYAMRKDLLLNKNQGVHINNDPQITITKVEFMDNSSKQSTHFNVGDSFLLKIYFDCRRRVNNPIFTFGIINAENIVVIANYSNHDYVDFPSLHGEGVVEAKISSLLIKPGNYTCTITLSEKENSNVLDWHERSFPFTIENKKNLAHGLAQLPVEWTLRSLS